MVRATILRIPDGLKAEAGDYAKTLGLSLNALCAVALRDYLDARRKPLTAPPVLPAPVIASPDSPSAPRSRPDRPPAAGVVRVGLPPERVAKPAGAASERSTQVAVAALP